MIEKFITPHEEELKVVEPVALKAKIEELRLKSLKNPEEPFKFNNEINDFVDQLKAKYGEEVKQCLFYHILIGSGDRRNITRDDFPGEDSIATWVDWQYKN